MLFIDYNSSIRDIFKQVEGVSQHGLEELFDDEVIAGRRSYAESIITAGLASKEDILNLVAEISSNFNFNEEHLRKSLKTILTYAEKDNELSDSFNSFPDQVRVSLDR